jgi:peptide/nickel transport system ATP-binding protein
MAAPVLVIEKLRVEADDAASRRPSKLLDEVTLTLNSGEILGVIGESGAGKSTLGLASLGYVRPGCRVTGGRVLFDGADLLAMSAEQLRSIRGSRIAYIAQSPSAAFNPTARVGRQIAEALVLHKRCSWHEAETRAAGLFRELDLPTPETFGQRFPHQVSGGQLQRAMIAMAIACGPELLVLDEPTSALDVTTQVEVLASIRNTLRRHHAAAIYITHDLAVAADLADRLMVLFRGRVVETASVADIIQRPRDDYTRRLVAARVGPPHRRTTGGLEGTRRDQPLLSVDNVSASYRNHRQVIRHISLNIAQGETLAIVGASGSGKSTLARVICGQLPREAGDIVFRGASLSASFRKRSRAELQRIQIIYQTPDTALNPGQRIGRILGRVVSLYSDGARTAVRSMVTELLAQVGLPPEFAHRRPAQLSGGQKQRIAIARALAAKPDLIVCDEITSALDPLVADEILNLLGRLQAKTGAAFIFITHDLGIVRRIADRVALMAGGEVTAQGPLDEILSAPFAPGAVLWRSLPASVAGDPNVPTSPAIRSESVALASGLAARGAAALLRFGRDRSALQEK